MFKIIFILVSFLIIFLIDLKEIVKTENKTKITVVYAVIFFSSFGLSILMALGMKPVSPAEILGNIIDNIMLN